MNCEEPHTSMSNLRQGNRNMTLRRIAQEITNLQNDPLTTGLASALDENNLYHWTAKISGPVGSLYANKMSELSILLPDTYPHLAPKINFSTPIFHPNVSSEGEVKLAELEPEKWSPAFTIRTLLISVQAMLSDPNLDEGCIVNVEAAGLYLRNLEEFKRKVWQ
jgi:ubiquitin-protein ligase